MQKFSVTITGLIVIVIGLILKQLGIPYVEADINTVATNIMQIAGIVISWYGRTRQGDVGLSGFKR